MKVTGFAKIRAFGCHTAYNNGFTYNGYPREKASDNENNCSKQTQ